MNADLNTYHPSNQINWLGLWVCLHPPSPFIITQPKGWHSFYCPIEGRRLSRPRWLATYQDSLPTHRWSVTCLSSAIRARHRVTILMKTNALSVIVGCIQLLSCALDCSHLRDPAAWHTTIQRCVFVRVKLNNRHQRSDELFGPSSTCTDYFNSISALSRHSSKICLVVLNSYAYIHT